MTGIFRIGREEVIIVIRKSGIGWNGVGLGIVGRN